MITGREKEIALLNKKFESSQSEFVALYGRRRIGKTFLVRNIFQDKFLFSLTGQAQSNLKQQLANFNMAMQKQHPLLSRKNAENWMEAFQQISEVAEKSRSKKKVIFIDELPWLDTARSNFIQALEHFWNSWASARKDVLLVVCGSAASWMINKLINSKGGLHNRVTQKIKIEPFTLKECEDFIISKNIKLNHYQLVQLYMVLGGIPFYWNAIEKGLSVPQNIDKLCFDSNGTLLNEFTTLFKSLFDKAEKHELIVKVLAKKTKGLTREEITNESGVPTGGYLTLLLNELEESGFIRRYTPFGKKERNSLYQLSDFFSLFHLKYINGQKVFSKKHWMKMIDHPTYRAWSGYAFEQVCLAHVSQIKMALGIEGVATEVCSWRSTQSKKGAQIDLVIDRRDGVINLFEMKFSTGAFTIDKKYDEELRNKETTFRNETQTKKAVTFSMLTTYGLEENTYSGNIEIDFKMDVLFEHA